MRILGDATVLYRFIQNRNVFEFEVPRCAFESFLGALAVNEYTNGLLNSCKIAFIASTFVIDDSLLAPYGRLVTVDVNKGSQKEVSFESCLFYFLLEFKRELTHSATLSRLFTMATPVTPDKFCDDIAELRDNYKLYTVLYKHNREVKVDDFMQLLTNGILRKCAEILEFVLDTKVYSNVNMMSVRYLLNLFLFTVHSTHPDLKKQAFQFDLFYLNLYCHCIRHNRVTSYDANTYIIENDYAGKTLTVIVPKKLFLKLCVSLVNIFACLHGLASHLYLPREIIKLLKAPLFVDKMHVRVTDGKVETSQKATSSQRSAVHRDLDRILLQLFNWLRSLN